MKTPVYPLLALLLVLTGIAQAKDATTTTYFDPATVDYKSFLPEPPADGSPTTLGEINLILEKQNARTPEEVARIQREVNLDVYLFDTVFGSWFTENNLPLTSALFHKVDATIRPVFESAKNHWGRPRPFLQDSRIHPPIDPPQNASYPSGHSTVGDLDALILSELAPSLKEPIMARGLQIGDDRVLAGVHFPSDVEAGRTLAHELFKLLLANASFQDDLAKAKVEIAAKLTAPSSNPSEITKPRLTEL